MQQVPQRARYLAITSLYEGAVYGWMALGLAITALTAWMVANSTMAITIAPNQPLFWTLVIVQLGIVFVLSARVDRLAPSTA